ncbi:MAG: MFS transporter [Verrucomicrobia bacterium]|nr:MFS transporter [Verrucomicrobiota bacterium]
MSNRWKPGAIAALALLLGINLFNYIDRQVLAAVEPEIRATFFAAHDPNAMAKTGLLGDAFLLTYMISAPLLGWLSDRFSRWVIIGSAVLLWSLASGGSGLAATFSLLFYTRICVGIGEGGYGPAAPTIIADLFPLDIRGRVMAIFTLAIPVGSALGYVVGGLVGGHLGWRWAFYLVAPPGILLALICFFMRDPRQRGGAHAKSARVPMRDYFRLLVTLFRTPSFAVNTFAQAAMTFAVAGLGFWVAEYLRFRGQPPGSGKTLFGAVTVVAGLTATFTGGVVADKLRTRFPGSYFLVSGVGMIVACPFFVAALYLPFPTAWMAMFAAIFCLFLNTGPSNTAVANVSMPEVRATAFAINILIIHMFGDVPAFPGIGLIAGHANIRVAFLFVTGVMLISGVIWIAGAKFLNEDTQRVELATAPSNG